MKTRSSVIFNKNKGKYQSGTLNKGSPHVEGQKTRTDVNSEDLLGFGFELFQGTKDLYSITKHFEFNKLNSL